MPTPILFLASTSGYLASVIPSQVTTTANLFIQTLRHLRRANPKISLHTNLALGECRLAPDEPLNKVLSGNSHKDTWRFLKSLQAKTPLSSDLESMIAQGTPPEEITLPSGDVSWALTWAHILGSGTVSFHAQPLWCVPVVSATHQSLDAQGNILTAPVDMRNASAPSHVATHQNWLLNLGLDHHPSASVFWEERDTRFPGLRFLERTRSHIDALVSSGAPYKQALATLHALNQNALDWAGNGEPQLTLKNAAGEHDQRRKLCQFRDDVTNQTCDFGRHAYFTGNVPGRIHFRISVGEKKIVIAHIGSKLID